MFRNRFGTIEKLRAGENRRQSVPNSGIKIFLFTSRAIKRERRGQILLCYRPPKGALRKPGNDFPGACGFFVRPGRWLRPAHKNAAAARRIAHTEWIERADDFQSPYSRNAVYAFARHEREERVIGFCESSSDKRDTDFVRPGFHIQPNVLEAAIDRGCGLGLLLVDGFHVFLAAKLLLKDLGAIDSHDDSMAVFQSAHVAGCCKVADVELVFAVGRKQMFGQNSTTSTKRQALDMNVLVQPARRTENRARCLWRCGADCLVDHKARRGYVLVEKRWRDLQDVRHIVETVRFVVLR